MADQQENKSSYTIPALLLIVAIIAGGIFWFYAPLDTMRPSLNEKKFEWSLSEENILARMWQDSFQAVENHVKNFEATKKKSGISDEFQTPEFGKDIKNILILSVMITAERYAENFEDRLRSRYAVLSALHVAGYIPKDAEYFSGKRSEELQDLFEYLQGRFKREPPPTIKVLGPTNSTSPEEIISKTLPVNCSIDEVLKKMYKYLKAQEEFKTLHKYILTFPGSALSLIHAEKEVYETAKKNFNEEKQEAVPDSKVKFKMYSPWTTADPLLMMAKKPISIPMLIKMYNEVQSFLKDKDLFDAILRKTGVSLQRSIHTDQQLSQFLS